MMHFGFGRADISVFEPEMTMMGWGVRTNRARGVGVPLHARALVLWDPAGGERVALVSVETLIVTQGLWFGVLDALAESGPELGLDARNTILVATHTHSGPSGFGHHFWTNFNAPGFSQRVYDGLRDGIVAAIREAAGALQPGRLRVARATLPLSEGVAFNRSWFAYNRNADVEPVSRERRDEATDRDMTVLRCDDLTGRTVGVMSWFALHGTSVHADHDRLHPDHKGLAALALEAEGVACVLAQECCGDVTPNYRWDSRRGHTIGRFDDDLESARFVADAQARQVRALLAAEGLPLGDRLQVAASFVDFGGALVDPRWSPTGRPQRTRPARLGVSMALGTAEGPGPLLRAPWVARSLNALAGGADALRARLSRRYERRWDPKFPFLDLARGRDGRLAGLLPMSLVPPLDPTFRWVRDAIRAGGVHAGPWVPQVVPLHVVRLGPLAIAALPFETTTVAGRRLRATLAAALPGVEHVVISPYASAYVGYLTTFEEYQVQHYEAGYTLFGPFTLGAVRTAFEELAHRVPARGLTGPPPPRVPVEPLTRIPFATPWPY